ncbi:MULTISPECIES: hypothetical protein [Paraburkholderia]|uniref:Uncharacterized protein n=1 Tax=Paraburkholderia pallida TaxID=2547399 RepID=A0A4V1B0J5_9BURK|nr:MULTISPECIES: hypothetical protein [Paraburkholderia]QBR02993.1 hypothetical protein E1956_38040 [Paraburkholderia pallida]
MLSPHELATLMLVKNAPDWIEPDRIELGALRELQLIDIEPPESGVALARVTPRGDALLRAVSRVR